MKKFFCMFLVLTLVLSCSAMAFAADSVTKPESDAEATAALPVTAEVALVDEAGNEVSVPVEDILIMLPTDQALEQLEGEELETFEKCFEAAKNEKDYVVTNFFWMDVLPEYADAIASGKGVKVSFVVPGLQAEDEVKVLVNGEDLPAEDVNNNGDGIVTAIFHEFGAVAIMTKAAE